jgi:hypothetical protein
MQSGGTLDARERRSFAGVKESSAGRLSDL